MHKIAVVILNWNGIGFMKRFVPGVAASCKILGETLPGWSARTIIADNGSTDGSAEWMESLGDEIGKLFFDKNHGFTGGYNKAFGLLETEGYDYFLLLNSDIEVTPGWLVPLARWMDSHPSCGIAAPKLRSYGLREKFEYAGAAGGFIDRWGFPFCRGRVLSSIETDTGQYDRPCMTFWASGAAMLVRREIYSGCGGLDETFFAHMEEIDLCWRAQLAGYRVTVVPYSTVYHVGGGSLPNDSPKKLYLNYRNNLLMLRKNLGKTLALKVFRSGHGKRESAAEGTRQARRTVFIRMLLDGMSCAVYLFTFKWKYVQAVIRAHRDFRRFKVKESRDEILTYLKKYGKSGNVEGLSGKWIIPRAMIWGKNVFIRLSSGQ